MNNKKWIKVWFLTIVFIILGIGGFNYLIDPYGINNFYKKSGINIYKKSNTGYTYIVKTNAIKENKFDTLMLGTSRIGSMNPEIVNKYINGKAFNFSIPISTTEIQYKLFLYNLKYNNIKHLIYGIDFMSFNKNRTIEVDYMDFYELEDKIENKEKISSYPLYFNSTTLEHSFDVLRNNISGRNKIERQYLLKNGMREFGNHIQNLKSGKLNIDANIKASIGSFFTPLGVYKNYEFSYKYLEHFKKIIEYCKNNNIQVFVYIPPMYSDHFDALSSAGYYDEFELFKKELVKITNYTDLTGHNTVSNNKHNYWDSSHLRNELTEVVMAKVFNDKSMQVPYDFGKTITKDNIDNHLEILKSQIKHYALDKTLSQFHRLHKTQ